MTDREMRAILREVDRECGIVDPAVVTPTEEEWVAQQMAARFQRRLDRPVGVIIDPYETVDFWTGFP